MEQLTAVENYQTLFNQSVTARRQEVLRREYHGIPLDEELCKQFNCSMSTLQNDRSVLRAWFRKQAARGIGEIQEQEFAYYQQKRLEADEQWLSTHKGQFLLLALQWSERISKLLGLDQPTKSINVNLNYNEYAHENGVSQHDVTLGLIRETVEMLKTVQLTQDEISPLVEAVSNYSPVVEYTPTIPIDSSSSTE